MFCYFLGCSRLFTQLAGKYAELEIDSESNLTCTSFA